MNLSKWDDRAFLNVNPGGRRATEVKEDRNELAVRSGAEVHRFRSLDGERFEYDVILLEAPRRPVVSLELAFPKGLAFYRQRGLSAGESASASRSPWVEGSYAVYWAERNGKFKTGKFCHIYRPELIDAAGKRVWGELELHGARLDILLPERWLRRARFPVVVDPVIGTNSVGASHLVAPDQELYYDRKVVVNPHVTTTVVGGVCRAYYYNHYDIGAGWPVIFSNVGDIPVQRLSSEEQLVEMSGLPGGCWDSATFRIPNAIGTGQQIWFGMKADEWYPYFDDGGVLKVMNAEPTEAPPDSFVVSSTEARILSMYFSYTAPQAYSASLHATASIADGRSRVQGYGRRVTANGTATGGSCARSASFSRGLRFESTVEALIGAAAAYVRRAPSAVGIVGAALRSGWFNRVIASNSRPTGIAQRAVGIVGRILDAVRLWDYLSGRNLVTYETVTLPSRITKDLTVESRV